MSITVSNVSFTYPRAEKPTLKGISFEAKEGSFVTILGETGAGKSTLVLALNGIIPSFITGKMDGDVIVDGLNVKDHETEDLAKHVGIVFDNPVTQIVTLTVQDEVYFGPVNLGIPKEEITKRADFSLKLARLNDLRIRNPRNLSGGQQQSLAIASIISMRPKILVMDEPICLLDPIGKQTVLQVIRDLKEKHKITILITESGTDIDQIAAFSDEIIFISDGKVVASGNPREIFVDERLVKGTRLRMPQVTELAFRLGETDPKSIPISVEEAREYFTKRLKGKIKIPDSYNRKIDVEKSKSVAKGKPIIEIGNLHYLYPGPPPCEALRGISLTIYEGEMVGLIGQNGSGKTTLSLCMVGLLRPTNTDAKLTVDGVDVASKKTAINDIIKHINYIFQNPEDQLFAETASEEMAYGLKNMGLSPEEIEEKIVEMLKLFGMEELKDSFIDSMSLNYKTFLTIASIMSLNPKILIIDEPTTGLDWSSSRKILEILRELNKRGRTIIAITHNMEIIAEYTDRIIVLNDGQILLDGPTREVFSKPEILKQARISPPQVTQLGQALSELGFPNNILRLDEMYQILSRNLS